MATVTPINPMNPVAVDTELHSGDRMSQPEFHRVYSNCPETVRAELIEGIVYVASPISYNHCIFHASATTLLTNYATATPNVESMNCGSTILGKNTEVQPDSALRIESTRGGKTIVDQQMVIGAPELVLEIAYSSRAIDLHQKRESFRKAGVVEYLVLCVKESELAVFDFGRNENFVQKEGIFRSGVFAGLWIDIAALVANDRKRANETLQQGLASLEHTEFVRKLTAKS